MLNEMFFLRSNDFDISEHKLRYHCLQKRKIYFSHLDENLSRTPLIRRIAKTEMIANIMKIKNSERSKLLKKQRNLNSG